MLDEEMVSLIAATYRRVLATELDPEERRIVVDLLHEAEAWLAQDASAARPGPPRAGKAVH